jgi:hypothetical protein
MIKEEIPAVDVNAYATGEGKSTISTGIRDCFRAKGRDPTVVRVESGSIAGASKTGEVLIPTERILEAADIDGGAFGALDPLWDAAESCASRREPLIMDWAGGQSNLHSEFLNASRLEGLLSDKGFTTYSVIVTTSRASSMVYAAEACDLTAKVAPGFRRILALVAKDGPFDNFVSGSPEAKAYEALAPEAQKWAGRLLIPRIEGNAWQVFHAAGLSFLDALGRPVNELAEMTGRSPMVVNVCRSMLAAWWTKVEPQIVKVLPVR